MLFALLNRSAVAIGIRVSATNSLIGSLAGWTELTRCLLGRFVELLSLVDLYSVQSLVALELLLGLSTGVNGFKLGFDRFKQGVDGFERGVDGFERSVCGLVGVESSVLLAM
jgi:hypothetical protein